MSAWVDFDAVKKAVSLEMVIHHYRIELRSVGAGTLRVGSAPLPMHGKDQQEPGELHRNTYERVWRYVGLPVHLVHQSARWKEGRQRARSRGARWKGVPSAMRPYSSWSGFRGAPLGRSAGQQFHELGKAGLELVSAKEKGDGAGKWRAGHLPLYVHVAEHRPPASHTWKRGESPKRPRGRSGSAYSMGRKHAGPLRDPDP